MPEISLDNLDTFGKAEDYRKPKEKYDRLDGRTPKGFMSNVEASNIEEDHHVAHISQLHNAAELGMSISIAGLGAREKFIENPADIPNRGDHTWFFHGDDPFSVNIEMKSRKYTGPVFRPKHVDVNNCLERNIPYLLVHNAGTTEAAIILLRAEEMSHIQDSYGVITHEIKYGKPWNPYQEDKSVPIEKWKLYYRVSVYDDVGRFQNRKISYDNLKRDNSYDEWMKVIEYFRLVSGKQN